MAQDLEIGIGISNVHERLRVLYGTAKAPGISSRKARGRRLAFKLRTYADGIRAFHHSSHDENLIGKKKKKKKKKKKTHSHTWLCH